MTIKILLEKNPYFISDASSNRWLSLLRALEVGGVKITIIVFGGYSDIVERTHVFSNNQSSSVQYIEPYLIDTLWKRRLYAYFGEYFLEGKIKRKILKEIESGDILWTDSSLFGLKMAKEIRTKFPSCILFLEMSEYLDIHKFNKGNFIQRWKADKRKDFFENKAIYYYTGIALMTGVLINHYRNSFKGIGKLLHLPMTVDLERFEKTAEPPSEFICPYIVFIGVMNNAKDGVNILLSAFKNICIDYPDLKLYLVGPWHYDTPAHLDFIHSNGMEDKIFWMGEVKREIIPAIVKNAQLLVLPRPDSKQAQGGFPTKLGEYLASGRPVCATRVSEIPDYLEDNKSVFFAEPGSVDSFSEAMKRALIDPELAMEVGKQGRKVAELHFNSKIQAKKLYDFFYELVKQNSKDENVQ